MPGVFIPRSLLLVRVPRVFMNSAIPLDSGTLFTRWRQERNSSSRVSCVTMPVWNSPSRWTLPVTSAPTPFRPRRTTSVTIPVPARTPRVARENGVRTVSLGPGGPRPSRTSWGTHRTSASRTQRVPRSTSSPTIRRVEHGVTLTMRTMRTGQVVVDPLSSC